MINNFDYVEILNVDAFINLEQGCTCYSWRFFPSYMHMVLKYLLWIRMDAEEAYNIQPIYYFSLYIGLYMVAG